MRERGANEYHDIFICTSYSRPNPPPAPLKMFFLVVYLDMYNNMDENGTNLLCAKSP